jgi:hypothetical protein
MHEPAGILASPVPSLSLAHFAIVAGLFATAKLWIYCKAYIYARAHAPTQDITTFLVLASMFNIWGILIL